MSHQTETIRARIEVLFGKHGQSGFEHVPHPPCRIRPNFSRGDKTGLPPRMRSRNASKREPATSPSLT